MARVLLFLRWLTTYTRLLTPKRQCDYLTNFLSLMALEIINMTFFHASSDTNFFKMTRLSPVSSCYPCELYIIFNVPHSRHIMHITCCYSLLSILQIWRKMISVNSGEKFCRLDTMEIGCCLLPYKIFSWNLYRQISRNNAKFAYDINLGSLNVFKYAQGPRESLSHSVWNLKMIGQLWNKFLANEILQDFTSSHKHVHHVISVSYIIFIIILFHITKTSHKRDDVSNADHLWGNSYISNKKVGNTEIVSMPSIWLSTLTLICSPFLHTHLAYTRLLWIKCKI